VTRSVPVLFADSNVFIEALFFKESAAAALIRMVAQGAFDIVSCQLVIDDVEIALLNKLKHKQELVGLMIDLWQEMKDDMRLVVFPDPREELVKKVYKDYIGVMRHKADIPVLTAALNMKPLPDAILSNNREHFNDAVSQRCQIYIGSCKEFLERMLGVPEG